MQSKHVIKGSTREEASRARAALAQEIGEKVFAHGVCVARLTKDVAGVFFKDGSRTMIDNLNGRLFIGCGRPDTIGMDGEILDRDSSMAANFARRLCAPEGEKATPEDEEIFSYCERLLLKPTPLDRKKGTKDHERKAADDHNKEVRKSHRTEASATIRDRKRRHVRG